MGRVDFSNLDQRFCDESPPVPEPAPGTEPTTPTDASSDRAALEALYNDLTVRPDLPNWLSDRPLGEWDGVTTNAEGRVTELRLTNRGLRGRIPPEIGNLTSLQVLDLGEEWNQPGDRNELDGEIPPEIGNLVNLRTLDLGFNRLSGLVPPEIASLTNLQYLKPWTPTT